MALRSREKTELSCDFPGRPGPQGQSRRGVHYLPLPQGRGSHFVGKESAEGLDDEAAAHVGRVVRLERVQAGGVRLDGFPH